MRPEQTGNIMTTPVKKMIRAFVIISSFNHVIRYKTPGGNVYYYVPFMFNLHGNDLEHVLIRAQGGANPGFLKQNYQASHQVGVIY